MSLKAFHIFFICVSILTALGFGYWALKNSSHALGIASLAVGVLLIAYLSWFVHKAKKLKHA